MLNMDDQLLGVLTLLLVFIIENLYYLRDITKGKNSLIDHQMRIVGISVLLTGLFVYQLIFTYCSGVDLIFFKETLVILTSIYGLTLVYFLKNDKRINLRKDKKKTGLILFLIAVFVFIIGSVISGNIFGENSWFSATIMEFFRAESVGAIMTFMTLGGFIIIIAKTRHSSSIGTLGYFLTIGLPFFDVLNTLFNDNAEEEVRTSAVYDQLGNLGLSLIVYAILKLLFYLLLMSILLTFISQMVDVYADD